MVHATSCGYAALKREPDESASRASILERSPLIFRQQKLISGSVKVAVGRAEVGVDDMCF